MALDLEYIDEFIVLARVGNFHKAAETLFITQPTLSNHIRSLEDSLGFTLLDRKNRNKLTRAGNEFYWTAVKISDELKACVLRCKSEFDKGVSTEHGQSLRLVASRNYETISSFEKRTEVLLPDTELEIIDYDLARPTLVPLATGEVDMVAIYDIPEIQRDVEAMELAVASIGYEPFSALLSRTNPLASAELASESLAECPVLEAAPFDIVPWLSAIRNMLGADLRFETVPIRGGKRNQLGNGIAIVTSKMAESLYLNDPDVVVKTEVNGHRLSLPMIIIYNPQNEKPALQTIIAEIS